MTPAPGTTVNIRASATPNSVPSDIGTFFAVGETGAGPVGEAVAVVNMIEYVDSFGSRTETSVSSLLYDAIDAFFQEGGQLAYISRVFASGSIGADTALLVLEDQAGSSLDTLDVKAMGPGAYGNAITIQVAATGDTFVLTVKCPGFADEISPPLTSPDDAVNWAAAFSELVDITNLDSVTGPPLNNPATLAATHLAGGTDNTSPADTDWQNALAEFISDYGIGQVAAPGCTVDAVYDYLIEHATTFNRFALLDAADNSDAATLEALAVDVQSEVPDPSNGFILAPWTTYAGLPTNTQTPPFQRIVAPSGPIAGAMARLASQGNNADVAAAGQNGILLHATGVTVRYSDDDRAALEPAGVAVIRNIRGQVQLYGYTTLSLDPSWTDVGNVRLRMQIVDGVRQLGAFYVFADIDAQGHTASAFGGQIAGYLNQLYLQGALYGLTAKDAFFVNVGPSINTPTTAAARELLASVAVRMSPTAEQVIIGITKYPVSQNLPS